MPRKQPDAFGSTYGRAFRYALWATWLQRVPTVQETALTLGIGLGSARTVRVQWVDALARASKPGQPVTGLADLAPKSLPRRAVQRLKRGHPVLRSTPQPTAAGPSKALGGTYTRGFKFATWAAQLGRTPTPREIAAHLQININSARLIRRNWILARANTLYRETTPPPEHTLH